MPSYTYKSPNNPPPLHLQHTLAAPLPHRVVPSLGFWQSATGSLHESRLSISGLIPPRPPPRPPCPPYPGLPPPSPPPPSRSKGRSESVELEEPPPNPPLSSNRVVGSIPPKPPNGEGRYGGRYMGGRGTGAGAGAGTCGEVPCVNPRTTTITAKVKELMVQ